MPRPPKAKTSKRASKAKVHDRFTRLDGETGHECWCRLKAAHPDALIGLQSGDFVDFVEADAEIVAAVLGIVLAKPTVGPYQSRSFIPSGWQGERQLDALRRAGHRVHVVVLHAASDDVGSEAVPITEAELAKLQAHGAEFVPIGVPGGSTSGTNDEARSAIRSTSARDLEQALALYSSCTDDNGEEVASRVLDAATAKAAAELGAILAAPPDRSQAGKQRLAELSRAWMDRWGYDCGDEHIVPMVQRLTDLVVNDVTAHS